MEPRVTVLLPTHNRADVLGVAIRSVLSQTMADFELLIVGDGCTDGTRDVVASFLDPRIVWFDLPKAPFSGYANRNIALRQARGRYVAYAQHDDIWFPDHLALLLKAIEIAGADWAYSRPLWVGRNAAIVPSPVNLTLPDELDFFMTIGNSVPSNCVLHTLGALQRVGYWPEDVANFADWKCWQLMIASSATPSVGYCRSATSLHFPTIMSTQISMPESALRESAASPWWPPILRCPCPPTERAAQETLWRALRDGGDAWLAAIRDAADMVVDHVALTTMRQWQPLAERVAVAERETARYRAEAEAIRADLAARTADASHARAESEAASAAADGAITEARNARELAQAAAEDARRARADTAQHRATLDLLHRSRSWRLTAPLRAAVNALRG